MSISEPGSTLRGVGKPGAGAAIMQPDAAPPEVPWVHVGVMSDYSFVKLTVRQELPVSNEVVSFGKNIATSNGANIGQPDVFVLPPRIGTSPHGSAHKQPVRGAQPLMYEFIASLARQEGVRFGYIAQQTKDKPSRIIVIFSEDKRNKRTCNAVIAFMCTQLAAILGSPEGTC